MSSYLLDTHIILWWVTDPEKISLSTRKIIENKKNSLFISAASIWEMGIKKSIGSLDYPESLIHVLTRSGFKTIPITPEDAMSAANLPMIHKDPFDRMLIIQAKIRNYIIITNDKNISQYPVLTIHG